MEERIMDRIKDRGTMHHIDRTVRNRKINYRNNRRIGGKAIRTTTTIVRITGIPQQLMSELRDTIGG